jgi:hypothetical protein
VSGASADEQALADALADASASDTAVRQQLDAVPAARRFDQAARWTELARDTRLPAWRRLAAYQLLVERTLRYPLARATFVREALAPLGVERAPWIDQSIAQHVPVDRRDDAVIRMIHLPIETPVGQAAVYVSLREDADTIEQAAVSPDLDRAAGQ